MSDEQKELSAAGGYPICRGADALDQLRTALSKFKERIKRLELLCE